MFENKHNVLKHVSKSKVRSSAQRKTSALLARAIELLGHMGIKSENELTACMRRKGKTKSAQKLSKNFHDVSRNCISKRELQPQIENERNNSG